MKKILSIIFRIFSFLYPYKLHTRLTALRNVFYTLWIKNFFGIVGEHSRICYPCSLQGGGQKNVKIGDYTTIQGNTILGCWVKYGKQEFPKASITIGNRCSIGEYNHITACNKITIGDGLLTGRYVIISDNSHGGLRRSGNRTTKTRPKIQRRSRHRQQCLARRQGDNFGRCAYWE